MATLVENAIRIKQIFDDIKDAINEKGQTTGNIETYPDAITAISGGKIDIDTISAIISAFNGGGRVQLTSSAWVNVTPSPAPTTDTQYFTYNGSGEFTCNKTGLYFLTCSVSLYTKPNVSVVYAHYIRLYNVTQKVEYGNEGSGGTTDVSVMESSEIAIINAGDIIQIRGSGGKMSTQPYCQYNVCASYIGE